MSVHGQFLCSLEAEQSHHNCSSKSVLFTSAIEWVAARSFGRDSQAKAENDGISFFLTKSQKVPKNSPTGPQKKSENTKDNEEKKFYFHRECQRLGCPTLGLLDR